MDTRLPDALFAPPGEGGDGAIVVALSGGLDSTVLLHRLAAQPAARARGLRALHVHHGLHGDADAWAAHCATTCATLGVPLQVRRVDVARDGGLGLEGAAREARRAAFADALGDGDIIALAHHLDDQAETFLLRALRASGPDGLAGMRPWRRFGRGWMWRPLLGQPREALESWARARGLAWCEDPANADPAHARSLLRHEVLPLLRRRWPDAVAALARSAALCGDLATLQTGQDEAWLDALAATGANDATAPHLPLAPLRTMPAARRARLLRAWAARAGLPPLPAAGVDRLGALADRPGEGRSEFRWAGARVRAWRDALHVVVPRAALPVDWSQPWDGRGPLALPGGGELVLEGADAFDAPLLAHARRGGERLRLPGRAHTHALKQLLQDAGVPPWERARLPLLSDPGGALLAAGDRILAAPLDAWLRARAARLRWRDFA